MIGARLGHSLDRKLSSLAGRISVSPNAITVFGFAVTLVAAAMLPYSPGTAGLLVMAGGALDLLDGAVARTNGKDTKFGALLDSTLDRYSDAALFIAIAWLFAMQSNINGVFLSIGALAGALLVSYVRARAEGLGIECKVGLTERAERLMLISIACWTGWFFPVVTVLFILGHVTVIQRVVHVYKKTGNL